MTRWAWVIGAVLVSAATGCGGDTAGTGYGGSGGTGLGSASGGTSPGSGGTTPAGGGTTPGSGGSSSAGTIQDALDATYAVTMDICGCMPTPEEQLDCVTSTDEGASFTASACELEVFSSSEGQSITACYSEAVASFSTCIDSTACATDLLDTCLTTYLAGISGCEPSAAFQAELDTCGAGGAFGAEPTTGGYTCADGTSIPSSWVCDGVEDCVGGEDEVGC